MLTADLVRARRKEGSLVLAPLDGKARVRAMHFAEFYVDVAANTLGQSRAEFERRCSAVEVAVREQKLARAIRKLVHDRCEFAVEGGLDPESVRKDVFGRAASARKDAGDGTLNRTAVLEEVASKCGVTPDVIERALYADLHDAQVLTRFDSITPENLVASLNDAEAQAILLRATRVNIDVFCRDASSYRALFHRLKFLRLLHTVTPVEQANGGRAGPGDSFGEGYRVTIDGPLSLFGPVQKYGLKLAMVFPVLSQCDRYRLEADVRWGKTREPLTFTLQGRGTERPPSTDDAAPRCEELVSLVQSFRALGTHWDVATTPTVLHLPGVGLCVPDLTFTHAKTRRVVYVERMGYWSRDAVWKRVELIERGFPHAMLFAVSERLRVSESVLTSDSSALYVYKNRPSARELHKRLERFAVRSS